MRKIILFLIITSLLLITFSCGGGGGSSQGVSPVTVSASFKISTSALRTAASTLTTIRYTVSGSEMNVMTGTVPVTGNLVEFILDVPNGPQRHFLIEALDSSGQVKYTGEAYRDLDGTPITITIVLVAVPPAFNLSGTWSVYDTYEGESEEGPDCMTISQTGNTFNFTLSGFELSTTGNGTIIGSNIHFQFNRCDNQVPVEGTGTTDGNTMSGTFTEAGVCPDEPPHSPVGTWRAVKGACTPPTPPTFEPFAHSQHWSDGYYVRLWYEDPQKTASSVTVTGPGITDSLALAYDTTWGWNSFTLPGSPVYFGTTYPTLPLTYTFTITDASGIYTPTATVECFMEPFATNLSATKDATGNLVFSWTKVAASMDLYYGVELHDPNPSLPNIWNIYDLLDASSVVYTGPTLTPGITYDYNVVVRSDIATGQCASFAQSSFTLEAACLTGTWTSLDLPYISMSLDQVGMTVTGTWVNSNTGCSYTGSGSYDSDTGFLLMAFTTSMDPFLCCQQFEYSGTVTDCNIMSLAWSNICTYSGSRQY